MRYPHRERRIRPYVLYGGTPTAYHASLAVLRRLSARNPTAAYFAFDVYMNARDLERLVTLAMPFGKYKGRLIADLPGHYLNWFAREGFPPGEIGRLLALMQELDHNGLRPLLDPIRGRADSGDAMKSKR